MTAQNRALRLGRWQRVVSGLKLAPTNAQGVFYHEENLQFDRYCPCMASNGRESVTNCNIKGYGVRLSYTQPGVLGFHTRKAGGNQARTERKGITNVEKYRHCATDRS